MTIYMMLLIFVFSVTAAIAGDSDPRSDMHIFAQEISTLQKYLLTDADFSSPKNESTIRHSLNNLDDHLKQLEKKSFTNDPALKTNLSLLTQHISDSKRAFKEGNKAYSRFMVQSSLQMCITCHTRMKTPDFAWPDESVKELPPLDRGEFLFATRQFEKGRESFEEVVAGYPGNKTGFSGLRRALLSLAIYYARVKEDPKAGAAYFNEVAKKNDFPLYIQGEVKSWGRDFQEWANEKKALKTEKMTETEIFGQVKRLLRTDDLSLLADLDRNFHIRRLRASALLHKILEAPGGPSPTKGQAIYYLGQIYNRIASNMFFRYGEMYLKACIVEYKKTSTARDCYETLERSVTEGYSGSSGTNIPDDEQIELKRLKRLAF